MDGREQLHAAVGTARAMQSDIDEAGMGHAIPISGKRILSMMERRGVFGTPEYKEGWQDAVRLIRSILYGYDTEIEKSPAPPE